jgi:hypothetical protein
MMDVFIFIFVMAIVGMIVMKVSENKYFNG